MLIRELKAAPEAAEDEDGFHLIPKWGRQTMLSPRTSDRAECNLGLSSSRPSKAAERNSAGITAHGI